MWWRDLRISLQNWQVREGLGYSSQALQPGPLLRKGERRICDKPRFTQLWEPPRARSVCILAWQALTHCSDCYRPALKGRLFGPGDDISGFPLGQPVKVFDEPAGGKRLGAPCRAAGPYPLSRAGLARKGSSPTLLLPFSVWLRLG